jgi:hypothetical protein
MTCGKEGKLVSIFFTYGWGSGSLFFAYGQGLKERIGIHTVIGVI